MRQLILGAACLALVGNYSPLAFAKLPQASNAAESLRSLDKDYVAAEKQKASEKKIVVVTAIRKALVAQKHLSVNAKNAKVVCSDDGSVTLSGPVDSESEKAQVAELAKACKGVTEVKNELTVAGKAH